MTNAEAWFNKSHIRKVYACLAVTCHLHFWQNDRDLLRATVVTRGWNGYRNKSQHRKSTLEKKILPPFQQGFEPTTFQSRVRCSNHWAIPTPTYRKFIYYHYYTGTKYCDTIMLGQSTVTPLCWDKVLWHHYAGTKYCDNTKLRMFAVLALRGFAPKVVVVVVVGQGSVGMGPH